MFLEDLNECVLCLLQTRLTGMYILVWDTIVVNLVLMNCICGIFGYLMETNGGARKEVEM